MKLGDATSARADLRAGITNIQREVAETAKKPGVVVDGSTLKLGDATSARADLLSRRIIGACIAVHTALGPGLLESAYEACLCHELALAAIPFERQRALPIRYKGIGLDCGYRLDIVVDNLVIVELKSVDTLLPVHTAQLLTYLKLTGISLGLLINFNVTRVGQGVKRVVYNFGRTEDDRSGSQRRPSGCYPFNFRALCVFAVIPSATSD